MLLRQTNSQRIHGIDIDPGNIAKAAFLQNLVGDAAATFETADIYDALAGLSDASWQMISALGIFYHLTDPLGLLSLMFQKTQHAVIIDTITHNFPFSGWIQTISRHVKMPHLAHANDTRKITELHPTYRGLIDSLFQIGFRRVIEIVPGEALLKKYPSAIYENRNRRMFVGVKS